MTCPWLTYDNENKKETMLYSIFPPKVQLGCTGSSVLDEEKQVPEYVNREIKNSDFAVVTLRNGFNMALRCGTNTCMTEQEVQGWIQDDHTSQERNIKIGYINPLGVH